MSTLKKLRKRNRDVKLAKFVQTLKGEDHVNFVMMFRRNLNATGAHRMSRGTAFRRAARAVAREIQGRESDET